MKKIIILENNKGRLANQLWLYSNVYAFCLEKKYVCENPSFYTYNKYFNTPVSNNLTQRILNNKYISKSKIGKIFYACYSYIKKINKKQTIDIKGGTFILPPDKTTNKKYLDILEKIDSGTENNFYFCGWLFRTPKGLEKYHKEIVQYFKPKDKYLNKIKNLIEPLRESDKEIVGVHIRHGDYKTWNGGKFYYSFDDVRLILEKYLNEQVDPNNVMFVICSDEDIPDNVFAGMSFIKGLGSEIEDLYTLAATDKIIGSNSSFGAWASYYGRIPFIVFPEKE